jgi:hypothetical protein
MIKNYTVVEYSVSQDCFHVQSLLDALKDNLMDAFVKSTPEYAIIGIFEDEISAHNYTELVRASLKAQNIKDVDKLINDTLK